MTAAKRCELMEEIKRICEAVAVAGATNDDLFFRFKLNELYELVEENYTIKQLNK